jgi:hypothetical protein
MAKNYEQLQQQQTFDELMRFLDSQFKSFPDHRAGNAVRYELADVMKSAFAMFSLKSPSLLDFKKQTIPEESNLRQIYRIEGAIPSDNQMRGMLDPFEHNYGHGAQNLATVLALLMLLAFLVDQIQQRCCQLFRRLWKGLGTKAKLWASLRNLFNVLVFDSMEALYKHMASLYRLQIE